MNALTRKLVLTNGLWILGVAAVVVLLVGGAVGRVAEAQERVRELEVQIGHEQVALGVHVDDASYRERLQALDERLDVCRELAAAPALRVAELSAAARAAGVTIVELESLPPKERDAGRVIATAHRLVLEGDYRQLAGALAGIADARGVCSVGELQIGPDDELPAGQLRASFTATWLAPGAAADAPAEEG